VARTSNNRVISVVACCHSVKLCALAARAFGSQQGFPLQTRKYISGSTMTKRLQSTVLPEKAQPDPYIRCISWWGALSIFHKVKGF